MAYILVFQDITKASCLNTLYLILSHKVCKGRRTFCKHSTSLLGLCFTGPEHQRVNTQIFRVAHRPDNLISTKISISCNYCVLLFCSHNTPLIMPRDSLFLLHFWPILSALNAFPITTEPWSFITILQNATSLSTKEVRNNLTPRLFQSCIIPLEFTFFTHSFRVWSFQTVLCYDTGFR